MSDYLLEEIVDLLSSISVQVNKSFTSVYQPYFIFFFILIILIVLNLILLSITTFILFKLKLCGEELLARYNAENAGRIDGDEIPADHAPLLLERQQQ